MKHVKTIALMVGFLVLAVAIAGGIDALASKLIGKPTASASPTPVVCSGKHASHEVEIKDNAMVPAKTTAKLCDTLSFTNEDAANRLVAFGPHDDHVPYDGVTEKLLSTGDSFTITLNQAGNYHFHDHIQDVAQGDFTVTK